MSKTKTKAAEQKTLDDAVDPVEKPAEERKVKPGAESELIIPAGTEFDTALATVVAEERAFALIQRKANMYCQSALVPDRFKGPKNLGSVVIALNMAARLDADELMVMQNLYVVYGQPSWSSKFLIACFNQCGRFSSIKYKFTGTKGQDDWGCIAYTTELATGETIEGTEVTIKMAKDEKWFSKNGSKWQTMPQLMLQYRSAAFLIRVTAPEISMGLPTREEHLDVGPPVITQDVPAPGNDHDALSMLVKNGNDGDLSDMTESEIRKRFDACQNGPQIHATADALIKNKAPQDIVDGVASEYLDAIENPE